jgi:hypothetical protein
LEPKIKNSGIPQGVLVKRHQVKKDEEGRCIDVDDLQIGGQVVMYGKTFNIVNVDFDSRVSIPT